MQSRCPTSELHGDAASPQSLWVLRIALSSSNILSFLDTNSRLFRQDLSPVHRRAVAQGNFFAHRRSKVQPPMASLGSARRLFLFEALQTCCQSVYSLTGLDGPVVLLSRRQLPMFKQHVVTGLGSCGPTLPYPVTTCRCWSSIHKQLFVKVLAKQMGIEEQLLWSSMGD